MGSVLGVRGGLSVDHLVAVGAPAAYHQLGGPGFYGALGGRLVGGTTVRLSAELPAAEPRFAEVFDALGVDVSFTSEVADVPRVWILDAPEGRRIVETAGGSAVELEGAPEAAAPGGAASPSDAAGSAGDDAFTVGLAGLLDSSPLARARVAAGTVVGVDPHQLPLQRDGLDYLRRVAPPGAVLLPSRVQLRLLDPEPRAAARRIADELGVAVVARLDREGMYLIGAGGAWTVRDPAVAVHETTGAGDSSAAAIVAALAQGADLVTAARFGASVARIALSDVGGRALEHAHPLAEPFPEVTVTSA